MVPFKQVPRQPIGLYRVQKGPDQGPGHSVLVSNGGSLKNVPSTNYAGNPLAVHHVQSLGQGLRPVLVILTSDMDVRYVTKEHALPPLNPIMG